MQKGSRAGDKAFPLACRRFNGRVSHLTEE
jgi:hypothetical protein